MKSVLILPCLLTACSAIFFPLINLPNQRQSMMNICIYSVNPARYQPKCFLCPSTVYPNVLRACVEQATIPSNISYTQASCIEQNCMIGRGKRSVKSESENYENLVRASTHSSTDGEGLNDENTHTEGFKDEKASDLLEILDTIQFIAFDDADYEEDEDYVFEDS